MFDIGRFPAAFRRGVTTPMVIAAAVISLSAPLISTTLINDRTAVEVERGIINPQ